MIGKEWQEINRATLWRAIRDLYRSKLVTAHKNADGSTTLILSERGREKALTYRIDEMNIQRQVRWDKKWRIVIFDIPERRKGLRDVFRARLLQLGFLELQKSVFVCPYPCADEIEFIVEYYQASSHVRMIVAESIDNALHFLQKFGLGGFGR